MNRKMDRKFFFGLAALLLIGSLIYFAKKSGHSVSVAIQPLTVQLRLSDEVKNRIEQTHAGLAVQAILTDKEISQSPLDATVINHREQRVDLKRWLTRFDFHEVELELPAGDFKLDPTLTLHVISKLDQPAGNCIQCDEVSRKLSELQNPENVIEVRCDRWLSMGVCIQPWQKN